MIQAIYGVLFAISILYMIMLLVKFQKHIPIYYTILSAAIVIVNLGHLQISGAKTLEAALLANQVVYLASTFLLLFMIAAIADLCKVKIPKVVMTVCVCICFALLLCAMSVGRLPWYYREVTLVQRNGCSFLSKAYGPLHMLYPAYIIGILLYGLGIVAESSGSHFDPELCQRFLQCRPRIEALYDSYTD